MESIKQRDAVKYNKQFQFGKDVFKVNFPELSKDLEINVELFESFIRVNVPNSKELIESLSTLKELNTEYNAQIIDIIEVLTLFVIADKNFPQILGMNNIVKIIDQALNTIKGNLAVPQNHKNVLNDLAIKARELCNMLSLEESHDQIGLRLKLQRVSQIYQANKDRAIDVMQGQIGSCSLVALFTSIINFRKGCCAFSELQNGNAIIEFPESKYKIDSKDEAKIKQAGFFPVKDVHGVLCGLKIPADKYQEIINSEKYSSANDYDANQAIKILEKCFSALLSSDSQSYHFLTPKISELLGGMQVSYDASKSDELVELIDFFNYIDEDHKIIIGLQDTKTMRGGHALELKSYDPATQLCTLLNPWGYLEVYHYDDLRMNWRAKVTYVLSANKETIVKFNKCLKKNKALEGRQKNGLFYKNGAKIYKENDDEGRYCKYGAPYTGIHNLSYYHNGIIDSNYQVEVTLKGRKLLKNSQPVTGDVNGELYFGGIINKDEYKIYNHCLYSYGRLFNGEHKGRLYKNGDLMPGKVFHYGILYKDGERYTGYDNNTEKYYDWGKPCNGEHKFNGEYRTYLLGLPFTGATFLIKNGIKYVMLFENGKHKESWTEKDKPELCKKLFEMNSLYHDFHRDIKVNYYAKDRYPHLFI